MVQQTMSIRILTRVILSTILFLVLSACATSNQRFDDPTPPPVTTEAPSENADGDIANEEQSRAEQEEKVRKGRAIAGALLGTLATIYVVTEYIEDKVVPTVLTLAVVLLVVNAAH